MVDIIAGGYGVTRIVFDIVGRHCMHKGLTAKKKISFPLTANVTYHAMLHRRWITCLMKPGNFPPLVGLSEVESTLGLMNPWKSGDCRTLAGPCSMELTLSLAVLADLPKSLESVP